MKVSVTWFGYPDFDGVFNKLPPICPPEYYGEILRCFGAGGTPPKRLCIFESKKMEEIIKFVHATNTILGKEFGTVSYVTLEDEDIDQNIKLLGDLLFKRIGILERSIRIASKELQETRSWLKDKRIASIRQGLEASYSQIC